MISASVNERVASPSKEEFEAFLNSVRPNTCHDSGAASGEVRVSNDFIETVSKELDIKTEEQKLLAAALEMIPDDESAGAHGGARATGEKTEIADPETLKQKTLLTEELRMFKEAVAQGFAVRQGFELA